MKNNKLVILFSLILILISHKLICQDLIVIKNSKDVINVTENLSILEDIDNKLTIKDILKDELQSKFVYKSSTTLQLSGKNKYQLQSTWIKFKIQNKSNDKVYLEIDNIDFPYCEIYVPTYPSTQAVNYEVKKVGILVPEYTQEIDLNYYLVSLLFAQDTAVHTIYLRVQYKGIYNIKLNTSILQNFFQRSHNIDMFYGIFFGIIFITFFYNLFVYTSFKDNVYLWYSFYIVSRGGITLANQGYGSDFFWSDLSSYNEEFIVVIFHLCIFSFIVFSMLFLETRKYTPFWHKGLKGLLGFLIVSFCFSFVYFYIIIAIWQILAVITFIYIFILSVYIYLKGNKVVLFYILADIFFITGFLIVILRVNQIIPQDFVTFNTYPIGTVLEIIFFFFALSDKIKALRKERETIQEENLKLVREQKETLEQRVKERTLELESKNSELQTQEEELRMLNDQLVVQQDNLFQINDHLEDLVDIKVTKLKEQNKQLEDYAFFNSHKVRGALARVMGLCILIEYSKDDMSQGELFDLIDKLLFSANELDLFVREINVILNEKPDSF